jgi:O-antigen/teichoic acid export membrane protein
MKMVVDLFDSMLEDKDLVKDSVVVFLSTSLANVILFLTNLYFSRLFGPESFGIFKTVLYLFTLLPVLIDFGMMITLPKYIAEFKVKDKKKISYMVGWFLKIRTISFLIFLAILFLFRNEIAIYFLHDQSLSYLILAGLLIVGVSFFNVLRQMVMGYENFKLFSVSAILTNVAYALIGIVLGYYFGIFYAIVGFSAGLLLGNLVCLKFLMEKRTFEKGNGKFDVKKIFWNYSMPMHLFLVLPNTLGTSMVPIMSLFFSTKLIGYYSFAFMFYFAALMIPMSIQSVLFPKVSRLVGIKRHKESERSLTRILGLYTLAVVLGVIGVLLLSRWFVTLIAEEYLPGLVLFEALVILGLFLGYFSIYGTYLSARGEVKKTAAVVLSQNLILFVVSFMLLSSMV